MTKYTAWLEVLTTKRELLAAVDGTVTETNGEITIFIPTHGSLTMNPDGELTGDVNNAGAITNAVNSLCDITILEAFANHVESR